MAQKERAVGRGRAWAGIVLPTARPLLVVVDDRGGRPGRGAPARRRPPAMPPPTTGLLFFSTVFCIVLRKAGADAPIFADPKSPERQLI